MRTPLRPGYLFATEAQWQACAFAGADRRTAEARKGLRPFAPFATVPTRFETRGAYAPAITDDAEILWRDDAGSLHLLPWGEQAARAVPAPPAIASAMRMVATPGTVWAAGVDEGLEAFAVDSLARLFAVDLPGLRLLDLAGDGRDGVFLLAASGPVRHILHVDGAGRVREHFRLEGVAGASALTFLGRTARLVLLAGDGARLYWLDPGGGPPTTVVAVSTLRSCFDVVAIGSDGCSRLFLAGSDGAPVGGGHRIVMVDDDGSLLGSMPVAEAPTGLVADRSRLLVTTAGGLLRFEPATAVPEGSGEIGASVLTPLLRSPAETPQDWLRIEAKVKLPPGCSIEIAHASPADAEVRERVLARLADRSVPQAERLDYWRRELAPHRLVVHGDRGPGEDEERLISAPLHDVRNAELWVQVALIAAPGGRMPMLSELAVLYPGPTLIEHLPAIYRRGEREAGDFLRALVGLLEAGTQDLDVRIGDLGRNIHPDTAGGEWLDYVAGWLGLPWDDALAIDQKRRIAAAAARLASGYGTRAGLEALLDSLMPERPRRFRIVDTTAEYGIAAIGGDRGEGSRLPALLAGLPASGAELGNKAILGRARLPCPEPETETARLIGRVRIDVAADAEQRQAWSPWLGRLIETMLPATVRAELRWLGPNPPGTAGLLSEDLSLDGQPSARLGTDAVTGAARLAGRKRTILPQHLSEDSTLH